MKRSINEKVNAFTVKSRCVAANMENLTATDVSGRVTKNIARQFDRNEN